MNGIDWSAVICGVAVIAWINWYFFLATRSPLAVRAAATGGPASGSDGVQEATVTVQGGYQPAAVRVQRGRPVRLVFDRQETSGCSEEVVLGDFNVRRFLPPHRKTAVEFTPAKPGEYAFTCGMGMLRGKVIVE